MSPPRPGLLSSRANNCCTDLVSQPENYFAQFRDEKAQAEFNEAVALRFPKLNKLRADAAEIPGLFSEVLSTPEGKLLAKEASALQGKGARILASEEFKAATEQAFLVFAGVRAVLSTPQAAAFVDHLQKGGGKATRIASMSPPAPPNVQDKAGGGGKQPPVPSKRSPPPNVQGGGAGGNKETPIPSKKFPPPNVQGGGGGKETPLAPMCSPPPNVQGEGGSAYEVAPTPSLKKQGGVGGGGKVAPIAPVCPPPSNVQDGRGGAGEGVGGSETGAVSKRGKVGASTTHTCSWKRVMFLLAVLVLAGDRLRLILATTTRGWTED